MFERDCVGCVGVIFMFVVDVDVCDLCVCVVMVWCLSVGLLGWSFLAVVGGVGEFVVWWVRWLVACW